MISSRTKVAIAFFAILLTSVYSSAQSTNDLVSLEGELKSLEEKYGISFSYLDENVKDIQVEATPDTINLEQSLKWLESQTRLAFHPIDHQYFAISQRTLSYSNYCLFLKDIETGEPVAQAVVDLDSIRSVSDDRGYVEIKSPSSNGRISISHIGYSAFEQSIELSEPPDCQTIKLQSKIATLDEVTVLNYISKGINKQASGEYIINSPQLQLLPGLIDADAFQSLQFLPGIFSAAESVSDINIRGGTHDQNLILWDGARVYQTGHFFGLISIFNPYFIDRVTLTKNGTSADQGEAVSGTIEIETENENPAKPLISGGFNLLNADVVTSLPLSTRTFVTLSARKSISNLLQTPVYEKYFDRVFDATASIIQSQSDSLSGEVDEFSYYDLGLKLRSVLSNREEISVSLIHAFDELNYLEENVSSGVKTISSEIEQKSTVGRIAYQRKWSDKFRSKLSGHVSQYELESINSDRTNNQYLYQKNSVLDWGLKLDMNSIINKNLELNIGYHFDELGVTNADEINNPGFSRTERQVLHSHVVYAEGRLWSTSKMTNLTFGARTNYYSQLDRFYLEPRLTYNQKLSENWSIEFGGELKSQTTTQIVDLQNDFLGVEKRRWVLANNDDIPIVKSKQVSLGLQYAVKNLVMSVEAYQKYANGIVTSSQSFQNQFEFIRSAGNYQVTGMDALINYRISSYSAWLSYTLSRNYNEFEELLDQKFPSNLDIRHFLTSGISYSNSRVECSLGLNWRTGNPYTAPDQSNPVINGVINYEFPNSSHLETYYRLDVSFKYKFRIGQYLNAQLGTSIWNVTNHENEVNAYYLLDSNDNPIQVIQSGLGITPNVSARVVF